MKKTMKKHLSLLLAVVMLVTSFSFAVSAESVCVHETSEGDPNYTKVYNPTCDEQGYTEYYCIKCGKLASTGNYKAALGHKYDEGVFVPATDAATEYRKEFTCTREYTYNGQKVKCNHSYKETEDGVEVVYYKVDFVNNKVTKEYDSSIDYTSVATAFTEKHLYTDYVKAGEAAVYEGDAPYREKTKEYARYSYIGWTEDGTKEATAQNNLSDADCIDLSKIEKNLTLYPVFEGLTQDKYGVITHTVTFYKYDNNGAPAKITNEQEVMHGATPLYSYDGTLYNPPAKDEDIVNTYEFAGWSSKGYRPYSEKLIANEDIESTPIYGDVGFYPVYNEIAKNYTLMFYDGEGKTVLKYTAQDGNKQNAVFNINLGKNLLDPAVSYGINALNNDAKALAKPGDENYIYTWSGKWAILNADGTTGRVVNLSYFSIYESEYNIAIDAEGNKIYENGELKKVIRLVPVYERTRQLYAVNIEMLIPQGEDSDYYRGGADVHVVANNGQLVASGTTDANGMFRCYLYNQTPFSVTVATSDDKYLGTATITSLQKAYDGSQSDEANMNLCRVQMTLNPEYETHCQCIHHNAFIQPIWVRILNILYNIFNYKYVCCYDMYSTIGPLLDYTA